MLDNLLCSALSTWRGVPSAWKLAIALAVLVPGLLLCGWVETTAPSGWYY
jgi:hypothetical protein